MELGGDQRAPPPGKPEVRCLPARLRASAPAGRQSEIPRTQNLRISAALHCASLVVLLGQTRSGTGAVPEASRTRGSGLASAADFEDDRRPGASRMHSWPLLESNRADANRPDSRVAHSRSPRPIAMCGLRSMMTVPASTSDQHRGLALPWRRLMTISQAAPGVSNAQPRVIEIAL